MSGYGDVRTGRMLRVLKWLQNHKGVEIVQGGRHNIKVKCIHTGETYPIASSHPTVNKHIVQDFQKWLVKNEVCTKDEFDARL